MKPLSAQTMLMAQYEAFLGGGDPKGGAMLTLHLAPDVEVPCSHTYVDNTYNLVEGGRSSRLIIERCEFRASLIPVASQKYVQKGLLVTLKVNPTAAPIELQLSGGGLMEGGEVFRFELISKFFGV